MSQMYDFTPYCEIFDAKVCWDSLIEDWPFGVCFVNHPNSLAARFLRKQQLNFREKEEHGFAGSRSSLNSELSQEETGLALMHVFLFQPRVLDDISQFRVEKKQTGLIWFDKTTNNETKNGKFGSEEKTCKRTRRANKAKAN